MTGTPIVNRLEDLFSLLSAAVLLIIRFLSSTLQAFLGLQAMVRVLILPLVSPLRNLVTSI